MSVFQKQLGYGQAGEALIARWLRSRGHAVLPAYEKIIDTRKGPRLFMPLGRTNLVAPDLLVFRSKGLLWVEAKHKTAFSWHRNTERWVTGIDLHHYKDYRNIMLQTGLQVWLLFLHEGGQAKDSLPSPAGLFGNSLKYLCENENHRHGNWGRHGMVYWAIGELRKLAEVDELLALKTQVGIPINKKPPRPNSLRRLNRNLQAV